MLSNFAFVSGAHGLAGTLCNAQFRSQSPFYGFKRLSNCFSRRNACQRNNRFVAVFSPRNGPNSKNTEGASDDGVSTAGSTSNGGSSGEKLAKNSLYIESNSRKVVSSDLRSEMSKSYMEYAMSVILGRALPDLRDGLKPVHRRILYAMHQLGIGSGGSYRKCARVVGEVLGKYHPHGDTAVYDALVRMAQAFSMGIPLIDGHGNFGSTDGDSAAAMRYTECRLSPMAKDAFLVDLELNTVDFCKNFDGSEEEPLVLPARVPNLLVNGSSGIAVGMATNIPPHNLGELSRALIALIRNPEMDDSEILRLIPAPDFPTGGQILGTDGAKEFYLTGRGQIIVRAKAHFEVLDAGANSNRRMTRDAIVITELPYQVNKATLVSKIAELVNDKKLDGIADMRDESDRRGTRVVIELRRDAEKVIVLNNLYKKTSLQHAFSANMLALDGGRMPLRLSLRQFFDKFIVFRRTVVRRRVQFELDKAKSRLDLVAGFLIAQGSIDEVIDVIRSSDDSKLALSALQTKFGLSQRQAEAVLNLQLRRLTALEKSRLEEESKNLNSSIAEFTATLGDGRRVDDIIVQELEREAARHSVERRSVIVKGEDLDATELSERSLLSNDQCVIVVTEKGHIKRMLTNEFVSQNRGTRGKRGVGNTSDDDGVAHFFDCKTHDMLLGISKRGIAYELPAYKVPIASRTSRGTPLCQMFGELEQGETMATVLPVSEFLEDEFLLLLTKNGNLKKTVLSAFENMNARGKIIIALRPDDELKWVRRCNRNDSMIIGSKDGFALRIALNDRSLRPSGRGSHGVRSMNLRDGDEIADMDIFHGLSGNEDSRFVLAVTTDGRGKRVESSQFRAMSRGAKGTVAIKFKEDSEAKLLALKACNDGDSVMLATKHGTIVRQAVSSISVMSRRARSILIQKLDDDDEVAAVTVVAGGLDDHDMVED